MLSAADYLRLGLDPALLFEAAALVPDPWQRDLLRSVAPRVVLNCCRQAGKSTTVAALALHRALFTPDGLVLLLSRAQRQASELFRKVLDFYQALGRPVPAIAQSVLKLELANGSRIVALPGKEANIRSYSGVNLLVIDEAARVADDLYRSVRPMLAVSGGRLILLSTPFGQRGFFWKTWTGGEEWLRVQVTANQVPRISPEFLADERRTLGLSWYQQEYEGNFAALEGLVYPDFTRCYVDCYTPALPDHKPLGGLDWGWANPFAAVWGYHDTRRDILYIQQELYRRQTPLYELALHLPTDVHWYADPASPREIEEMRVAGFLVHAADNALRAGIAAVTARIQTGRLKVLPAGCPNLCAEAGLYRYPRPDEVVKLGENPVDEDNHALAALRYLVSRLDRKFMIRFRRLAAGSGPAVAEGGPAADRPAAAPHTDWLDPRNEALWTPLN